MKWKQKEIFKTTKQQLSTTLSTVIDGHLPVVVGSLIFGVVNSFVSAGSYL